MTISSIARHLRARGALLLMALLPFAALGTPPSPPPAPVLIAPSPALQFQQRVQQQQLSDQLQKNQLSQQLQQNVSDLARQPLAGHPRTLQQIDQADQARRDRAQAQQHDLLQREQDAAALPRAVPQVLPAPARSGG